MLWADCQALQQADHEEDFAWGLQLNAPVGVGIHGAGTGNNGMGKQFPPDAHAFIASGISTAIVANRLSFCFKFSGSSVALDTACSSGLAVLGFDCQHIGNRWGMGGLCGGIQLVDLPASVVMHLAHELSTQGWCATFGTVADEFAHGRNSSTNFCWEPFLDESSFQKVASILGFAAQHAGRSAFLIAPSGKGQKDAEIITLKNAYVFSNAVAFAERRGAGIVSGGAVEVETLEGAVGGFCHPVPRIFGIIEIDVARSEGSSDLLRLSKLVLQVRRAVCVVNPCMFHLNFFLVPLVIAST